jgi:hypothetical protein
LACLGYGDPDCAADYGDPDCDVCNGKGWVQNKPLLECKIASVKKAKTTPAKRRNEQR